ncbi:MAG TPA: L-aspartate oxidase [Coriobacteriia bacterium]|nr:L-aspartate oxidase [Coriobacteriia bacterium]
MDTPADTHRLPRELERRWLVEFDERSLPERDSDVLIIGSGIAGLTAALHASRSRRVALVTKGRLEDTNTWYAQGGIAGAVGEADSVELHLADTLVVGQGLCDEQVVRAVVAEAPEALADLRDFGMLFDRAEGGEIALAREGGHSLPRVLHSGDKTGAAVQDALTQSLRTSGKVEVFERRFLVDLLTEDGVCAGAVVYNSADGTLEVFRAPAVVLATGGAGQVFPVTTNPIIATGDGVAAAWRAGAEISDLEFVQFHPTALDHESAPRFLVSEALRGEGAYLLDCDLQRFMIDVHPLAELAPRDVVSREIERVMARCGRHNVWLDARHLGEPYLRSRFPTIWKACAEAGYDLAADLLPVAPAAHYMIGGVRVDIDGRTSLPGLFASGECAASGLHGANRLASNSLLEGLVFSRRIVRSLDADGGAPSGPAPQRTAPAAPAAAATPGAADPTAVERSGLTALEATTALREAAGRFLGMSRTAEGLSAARVSIASIAASLGRPSDITGFEAANLLTVAGLIAEAAHLREESRGCHSRIDYAERDDEHWLGRTVWKNREAPRFEALHRDERRGG